MIKISLDGEWKLYGFPQGEQSILHPRQLEGLPVLPATVPGNVELDLSKAGKLPEDLYFGDNVYTLKPYEYYEWWYVKAFHADSSMRTDRVELLFHGVDCLAEYWLNGQPLGSSDNMLVEHSFDVTGRLDYGQLNTLAVRLKSPLLEAAQKEYDPWVWAMQSNWEQLWIRKAAHSYGWDIMPRILSAGLWRSVELVSHDAFEIKDVYFYTRALQDNKATVGIQYQLQMDPHLFGKLELEMEGKCGESAFFSRKKVVFSAGSVELEIADPKLWWPAGYGEANLYELEIRLLQDGKVLACRKEQVGIRTVELIQRDNRGIGADQPGEFLFKVNQVPILFKGSNWVPADGFHSRDAGRYREILEMFRDTNCNILRSWGGNVYEDHAFFELCDEFGIMVWQDFAMGCASYPQAPEFMESIRKEAVAVIRKLRNHPSILLWAGDNENDIFYVNLRDMDPANNKLTREVLPQAVFQCDPYRPYLASSPYYSPFAAARKDDKIPPEQHLWGPRDYYKSRFYTENTAHFASEIGYHGCPNLASIQQFIDEDHLWPWQDNDQWITHCTDCFGKEGSYSYRIKLMADQIREMFGLYPDNLQDFILASQISQAEAKKFFIEMVRLRKWNMTGIIWWNLMDGWPQFSDAVVDYYYGKKLAYYYIKRVQEPFCIMVDEPESWHVRVVAGNDSLEGREGQYRIWDGDTGETLMEGNFRVGPNENKELGKIRISHSDKRLFLIEWTLDGKRFGNHYTLGFPAFDLERYREWLKKIAALQGDFAADEVGK